MSYLEEYRIKFTGLKDGQHDFTFKVADKFFKSFEYSEIKNGDVTVDVNLEKRSTHLVLHFTISGEVEVQCDRCLDQFYSNVENRDTLYVKFGKPLEEEETNIMYIEADEFDVDIRHHIYELIILSLPMKRVHDVDANDNSLCNVEMLKYISGEFSEDMSEDDSEEEEQEEVVDPRWASLKNLKLD